ncbi:hypothetical protein GF322_04680 [Candidatus Dependentiae bacterium]|nr:hypothetical protein [Candidatus Dependentiae bacterium]
MITILIYFHHSKFGIFKNCYNIWISRIFYNSAFKKLVNYNRFLELALRNLLPLFVFTSLNRIGRNNGILFIDSTPIKVCNNRRISINKVFKK